MKERHAPVVVWSTESSKRRSRRIKISVLVVSALVLAAYGYWSLRLHTDREGPVAACIDCASTALPAGSSADQDASHGRGSPGALGQRIVSAIQSAFAAFETAWRSAVHSDSAAAEYAVAQCEQGVPDSYGRCGRSVSGTYPLRLPGQRARAASGNVSSISGRVMDSHGLGIVGIPVTIVAIRMYEESQHGGKSTAGRPTTTTDSSGYYEFAGLPAGDYEVRTAASDAYGPGRLAARSGVTNADIVLVADDTLVIEGEVVGVAGERLEAVTVLPVLVGVASVRTDAFGSYRLEVPLKPGTRSLTVRFQLPGFLDQSVVVDLADQTLASGLALNARLQPIQAWTGVSGVVRSATGSPLAGRSVTLRRVGGQTAYRTRTDRRGRYSFDAVEAPVQYDLSVSGAPDHEDHRQKIDVATHAARFDVVVNPFEFGAVSGRLVNADGAPVSNLDLVLRNKASQSPSAAVSSDSHGNFRVAQAPAGELTIASQSSPSILVRGLRLAPGDELDVALVLDWGDHELRGVVVDHNNNPVPATKVLLTWSHVEGGITTTTTRRTRSDAQGAFNFSNLGPGPHLLQVDSPGRRSVKMTHDITREGYFVRVGV